MRCSKARIWAVTNGIAADCRQPTPRRPRCPRPVNYLAHLHLSEAANLPLSGAVLGDIVRGRLEQRFPSPLEQSIRLHRRIDVLTDSHPLTRVARERFPPETRRYAGIVLDVLYDHCMALDWPRSDTLSDFARRCAVAVADPEAWRLAGATPPCKIRFERLLCSYRNESGIDRTISRIASRLKQPQLLHDAARSWRTHVPQLRAEFPLLLNDLERAAYDFTSR